MSPTVSCLASNLDEAARFEDALVFDTAVPACALGRLGGIVLTRAPAARAEALLERGVRRVFVGDAALADGHLVERLVRCHGGERVGVYAAARRTANRWSFETESNADFKVVAPSCGEPTWEVLRADGSPGAPSVQRWIERMAGDGAHWALVQADVEDDDLNVCAGLADVLSDRLCMAPRQQRKPALDDWVRYGHVRWIALPPALYVRRKVLLTLRSAQEPA